jgi:hypothetical protein
MTVSLLNNEEVDHRYVAYAIGRAAENIRDAYPEPSEELLKLLKSDNPELIAYAIFALRQLGKEINIIPEKETKVKIYQNGKIRELFLGEIFKSQTEENKKS